ncbi:MAG: hypothetical protein Q8M37_14475 [Nevskia sp.]|nr:hypothetical protein [Nevskia sp.]
MSEPKPPALPDDDRELDDFLAGRSELSRLYRQDAAEIKAPEALDAAVLAAAQSSLPVPKAKPARLRRWRLPLSLAASMVLGIAVLREVPREPAMPPASAPITAALEAQPPAPAAAEMPPPRAAAAPIPERAEAMEKSMQQSKSFRAMPDEAFAESPTAPIEAPEPAARAQSAAKTADPLLAEAESHAKADDDAWQPARYRGLQLGTVTAAEWQRQIGHPAVMPAPSGDARLATDAMTGAMTGAKPEAAPQLDYGQGIDPRGSLRAELDPQQRVGTVTVELRPALLLQDVEQAEALSGTARRESQSAPPSDRTACRDARASELDEGRVGWRVYPERGIELRLDDQGRVTEIHYRAARPRSVC